MDIAGISTRKAIGKPGGWVASKGTRGNISWRIKKGYCV